MYMQRLQKITLTCLMALSVHASYSMENDPNNRSFYKGPADLKNLVFKGAKYGAILIGLYGFVKGMVYGSFGDCVVGGGDMPSLAIGGGLALGVGLGIKGAAFGGVTGGLSGLACYGGKSAVEGLFNSRRMAAGGAVIGGTIATALCGYPVWCGILHSAATVYGASRVPKRTA